MTKREFIGASFAWLTAPCILCVAPIAGLIHRLFGVKSKVSNEIGKEVHFVGASQVGGAARAFTSRYEVTNNLEMFVQVTVHEKAGVLKIVLDRWTVPRETEKI